MIFIFCHILSNMFRRNCYCTELKKLTYIYLLSTLFIIYILYIGIICIWVKFYLNKILLLVIY